MRKNLDQEGFDSERAKYVRLDSNKWLKDKDIEKKGRERGAQDLPATNETQDDSIYLEIANFIGQRARNCRQDVIQYVNDRIADMTALAKEWEDENPEISLQQKIDEGCSNLDSEGGQEFNHVEKCRNEKKQAENELEEFKVNNKLDRVALYPENQPAHWAWVPVAGIVESFVSANLLGSVSRGGTLEGWVVAIVLTLVNVLIGIGAGWFCRLINHVNVTLRNIGAIAATFALILALLWNTVAGHVRDAYVYAEKSGDLDSIDNAFARAVEVLLESPLPWESFQSAGLVLVGIAVFVLTTYKAYRSDDRYPGYGSRHRQVKQLTSTYEIARDEAIGRLKDSRDSLTIDIDEFKDRHTLDKTSWETNHEEVASVLQEYEVNLQQYNLDLVYLLAAYRDANVATRNSPPPAFFSETRSVDSKVLLRPDIDNPKPFEWGDIEHIAQDGFKKINDLYDKWRNSYVNPDKDATIAESAE